MSASYGHWTTKGGTDPSITNKYSLVNTDGVTTFTQRSKLSTPTIQNFENYYSSAKLFYSKKNLVLPILNEYLLNIFKWLHNTFIIHKIQTFSADWNSRLFLIAGQHNRNAALWLVETNLNSALLRSPLAGLTPYWIAAAQGWGQYKEARRILIMLANTSAWKSVLITEVAGRKPLISAAGIKLPNFYDQQEGQWVWIVTFSEKPRSSV